MRSLWPWANKKGQSYETQLYLSRQKLLYMSNMTLIITRIVTFDSLHAEITTLLFDRDEVKRFSISDGHRCLARGEVLSKNTVN